MKEGAARRVALTGMLFALAIVFSVFESIIAPFFGLPPGIKLGLSNIVVLFALVFLSPGEAYLLVILKAAFSLFSRGGVAGALSFAGGTLSFVVMLLLMLPKKRPSLLVTSILGAVMHNVGQLALFAVIFGAYSFSYLPILLLSGIAMGSITALLFRALLPFLERIDPSESTIEERPEPTEEEEKPDKE